MNFFRRFSKELPQSNSTSNACMASPGLQLQELKGKLKKYLKDQRPVFRWVYGFRALREGFSSALQGKRGAASHVGSSLSFMAGSNKIIGRPMNVTIEPTNFCNLHCPVCETGAGVLGRKQGHMSFEDFKTIIDKVAPYTNTLMFYFMGEPFLNKHSYEMIRYAKQLGIRFITTCTNGDLVDPEKLVDCGIDEVSFQMGGTTQETHQIYRINSNLPKVLAHLKETLRIRNEKKSRLKIQAGFILMKHNEHQVADFRKTMAGLGVDSAVVIDPCVRTIEEGNKYLPQNLDHWFYDPEAFKRGVLRPRYYPPNECPWIYYAMNVHVTGNVVPCCRDALGTNVMGNLLTQSLEEVWNGPAYRAFRDLLHKDQSQIEICRLCSSYAPSPIK